MNPTSTKPTAKTSETAALGAQFRRVRKRQKVFLREMARRLKRSINTIRWHEAGDRMMRADDIVKSAAILGVDPSELITIPGGGNATSNVAAG